MTHPLSRRLAAVLAACSTLLLAACGDDGADEGRFSAALYGPVSSPAFDALRGLLTVGDPVASAQVLVNTNGIAAGGSTVATVLASNAVASQAQLTVRNGP